MAANPAREAVNPADIMGWLVLDRTRDGARLFFGASETASAATARSDRESHDQL